METWKEEAAHRDGSPYLGHGPVAGRDERPRSSAWEPGLLVASGQLRMAEATPSGRGFDGGNDALGFSGRGGSPGTVRPTLGTVEVRRLPLLLGMPVAGRDERPRSSAWEPGLARAWDNRGWLKPPPPEEGLVEEMIRSGFQEEAAHRGRFALPWIGDLLQTREQRNKAASKDAPATLAGDLLRAGGSNARHTLRARRNRAIARARKLPTLRGNRL